MDLPTDKKYNIIYLDPPWVYDDECHAGERGAIYKYPLMTMDELKALPVDSIAADDSVLFVWVTFPKLEEIFECGLIKDWGFCCQIGTKVLTSDLRWVNAESLKIGDRVISFDEYPINKTNKSKYNDRRYFQWGTVLSTGIEPIESYEITLSNGKVLTCTGNHKWLGHIGDNGRYTKNIWISTLELVKLLNEGWNPKLMKIMPVEEIDTDYDAGFLSAAFDGEGSITKTKWNLCFNQKPNDFLDSVEEKLIKKGFDLGKYSYKSRVTDMIMFKGGRNEALKFLMKFRPPRLLSNWNKHDINQTSLYNMKYDSVISVKSVGLREVVTLMTDKATYLADGYGAHNTYKTNAFTWIKKNEKGRGLFWGMGRWTRSNAEICLLATKGKPQRVDAGVHSVITTPIEEHSKKPSVTRDRIVQLCGDLPRIELFARQAAPGWNSWGLDVGNLYTPPEKNKFFI